MPPDKGAWPIDTALMSSRGLFQRPAGPSGPCKASRAPPCRPDVWRRPPGAALRPMRRPRFGAKFKRQARYLALCNAGGWALTPGAGPRQLTSASSFETRVYRSHEVPRVSLPLSNLQIERAKQPLPDKAGQKGGSAVPRAGPSARACHAFAWGRNRAQSGPK